MQRILLIALIALLAIVFHSGTLFAVEFSDLFNEIEQNMNEELAREKAQSDTNGEVTF